MQDEPRTSTGCSADSRGDRGGCRIFAEYGERETMAKGLDDLSSILNPSLFISPFTVDAKTA